MSTGSKTNTGTQDMDTVPGSAVDMGTDTGTGPAADTVAGAGGEGTPPSKKSKTLDGAAAAAVAGHPEQSVGITLRMGGQPPYGCGSIKSRWSDFAVVEVGWKGPAVITTLEVDDPSEAKRLAAVADLGEPTADNGAAFLAQYVGADAKPGLDALVAYASLSLEERRAVEPPKEPVRLERIADKAARTRVHVAVKHFFAGSVASGTVDGAIQLKALRSKGEMASDFRWPADRPDYLLCAATKYGLDSAQMMQSISKALRIGANRLGQAGTKDKHAITSQWLTFKGIEASRLLTLEKMFVKDGVNSFVKFGNFAYIQRPLTLGTLKGNMFCVVVRDLVGATGGPVLSPQDPSHADTVAAADAAVAAFASRGFINYFGLQRFGGMIGAGTHEIGRAILKGNLRKALEHILAPTATDDAVVTAAKNKYLVEGDAAGALEMLPRRFGIERVLLEGILEMGETNLLGVFQKLRRSTQSIYVHAYQSRIWNDMASLRLKTHGFAPAVGDLVVDTVALDAKKAKITAARSKKRGRKSKRAQRKSRKAQSSSDGFDSGESFVKGHHVPVKVIESEQDAAQYSLRDIVLPLPGHSITLPPNMADAYTAWTANDGIDISMAGYKSTAFETAGAYRKLVVVPTDVSIEHMYYDAAPALAASSSSADEGLVPSLLDHISLSRAAGVSTSPSPGLSYAVLLKFTLPASSYATMAMREVMGDVVDVSRKGKSTAAAAAAAAAASSVQSGDKRKRGAGE